MTLREKWRRLVLVWLTSGLALGSLGLFGYTFAFVLLLAVMLLLAFFTTTLRCPTCGNSVLYSSHLFGFPLPWVRGWIPSKCPLCGAPL